MENLSIKLSSSFKDILRSIGKENSMSRFILNVENSNDFIYPFSYIDITNTNDQISFIQSNKYFQIVNKERDVRDPRSLNINELLWTGKYRNNMKIGRLINRIAPFFDDKDLEEFVNLYKAEHKKSISNIHFEIVEGDQLIKFYNGKRYSPGNGPLNKSCMRHDHCEPFMDLYKKNPDKIKMLILWDSIGKSINGRALLWKLDEPADMYLLDRIYTRDDSDIILFKRYADENGWLYKSSQTFDAVNVIKDNDEVFIEMKIFVRGDFQHFPYIDTLLYYDKKGKYLTNVDNSYNNIPSVIKLREINGNDSGNENFVYDIFNDEFIRIDDSMFCFYGDGYSHKNNSFFIEDLDEYCVPFLLRYSNHHKKFGTCETYDIYSHNLGSFLNHSEVVKVYMDKELSIYDYYLKDSKEFAMAKLEPHSLFFHKSLLVKGANGQYYFIDDYDEEKILKEIENKKNIPPDLSEYMPNSVWEEKIGFNYFRKRK